jgi:hypothetical protein
MPARRAEFAWVAPPMKADEAPYPVDASSVRIE